jgi:hypothetical protein
MRGTGGQQLLHFFGGERERILHFGPQDMVVLRGRILRRLIFCPHFFQLFRGIECIVRIPLFYQLGSIFFIKSLGFALALPVGTIGARTFGALVGLQSTPLQTVEDIFFRAGNIAALVGIFDTKDKISAMLTGKQIVIQDGAYAS